MRISLTEWAAGQFSPAIRPKMSTLRAWAAAGYISDCIKIGGQWMPSHDSVYCEQPAPNIPENVSARVASILEAAA